MGGTVVIGKDRWDQPVFTIMDPVDLHLQASLPIYREFEQPKAMFHSTGKIF